MLRTGNRVPFRINVTHRVVVDGYVNTHFLPPNITLWGRGF